MRWLSAVVVWLVGAASSPAALAQGPPRVDEPGHTVAPTGAENTAPAPLTWYGWQPLLVDGAAVALVLGNHRDDSSVAAGLALFAAGGPTIHLLHREPGKAALSFALRTLVPLALLFAITSPDTDGGPPTPGYLPALEEMLAASIFDAAALSWQGAGPRRRGHIYARAGILGVFSTDARSAAAFGLGYRHEAGSLVLDVSALNGYAGSGLGRGSDHSSVSWSSFAKVLALGYLDRLIGKDVYVGGGVSYGEIAIWNPPPSSYIGGTSGRGLQTELVAGIELTRRTAVRTFIELDATLPLYRVRQFMGATAISEYAFTTTLSLGFGI